MTGQAALIAAIAARAPELPGCRALFLTGSFARGEADAVSDVDFLALAEPEHHAALATAWRAMLAAIMPVAFWAERRQPMLLLNAIGDDWLRCDLVVMHPALIAGRARNQLRALHDPDDLLATLPATLPPARADPARILATIEEFIRILGLLPVVVAREEWVSATVGTEHLRRLFTTLLLEDVTVPDRGGALHLSRLLPPADIALLASLPYPRPERVAVIDAHLATAAAFFLRARALAAREGVAWPEHFEAVTRAHLARTLGIRLA